LPASIQEQGKIKKGQIFTGLILIRVLIAEFACRFAL